MFTSPGFKNFEAVIQEQTKDESPLVASTIVLLSAMSAGVELMVNASNDDRMSQFKVFMANEMIKDTITTFLAKNFEVETAKRIVAKAVTINETAKHEAAKADEGWHNKPAQQHFADDAANKSNNSGACATCRDSNCPVNPQHPQHPDNFNAVRH